MVRSTFEPTFVVDVTSAVVAQLRIGAAFTYTLYSVLDLRFDNKLFVT